MTNNHKNTSSVNTNYNEKESAPESAKNTVHLLNDGWVIDVRDAAGADKTPTTRKRDIKL